MLPLTFYEYIDMKKFYNKDINQNYYVEFQEYIRQGGFPGSIKFDNLDDKMRYTQNIIKDIFKKDIKPNEKIKNPNLFNSIQNYVINNYGSMLSINSIKEYYNSKKINIDERTIKRYLNILENAKLYISVVHLI